MGRGIQQDYKCALFRAERNSKAFIKPYQGDDVSRATKGITNATTASKATEVIVVTMKSNNNHGGLQHSPTMTRLHTVDDKRDKN
jgi:hypothetical protein